MKSEILPGADTSLEELFTKILALNSVQIEAGFLTPKKHPESDLTLPEIAWIQQNGSNENNIPARPFITDGAFLSTKEIPKQMERVFYDYLVGNKGLAAFEPIAKVSRESIAKAIAMQKFKALSPITLKIRREKGNASPLILIDSAYMINNIESKVHKGKK